jgi:uncharacterized protein (DUF427 family)
MTDPRPRLEPGPDHPITIQPHAGQVRVQLGTATIAQTDRALELREASYPPVLYIPLDDVDQHLLQANKEHTYCPYKGEASYYDILQGDSDAMAGAVWYYPDPFGAVEAIRGHVAFYADRVTISDAA